MEVNEIWTVLQETLAEVINLEIDKPTVEIGLNLVPEWDSLKQAEVIEALEEAYSLEISDSEFEHLTNVLVIYEYLIKRNGHESH